MVTVVFKEGEVGEVEVCVEASDLLPNSVNLLAAWVVEQIRERFPGVVIKRCEGGDRG